MRLQSQLFSDFDVVTEWFQYKRSSETYLPTIYFKNRKNEFRWKRTHIINPCNDFCLCLDARTQHKSSVSQSVKCRVWVYWQHIWWVDLFLESFSIISYWASEVYISRSRNCLQFQEQINIKNHLCCHSYKIMLVLRTKKNKRIYNHIREFWSKGLSVHLCIKPITLNDNIKI